MGKNGKAVICVSTREASLKKRLRRHLKSLGFHKTDDGVGSREFKHAQRREFTTTSSLRREVIPSFIIHRQ